MKPIYYKRLFYTVYTAGGAGGVGGGPEQSNTADITPPLALPQNKPPLCLFLFHVLFTFSKQFCLVLHTGLKRSPGTVHQYLSTADTSG